MFLFLSLHFLERKNMRPTGPNRPTLITAWRKPNRIDVIERIQALARELAATQSEMHSHLAGPAAGKPGSLLEDAEALQALNHLKAELDQLRRILWFYMEEEAHKPVAGANRQEERAQAAPRALVPQSSGPSAGAEPGWFFDRLDLVIDTYMQGKKPAAAIPLPRTNTKAFS
jgi:hypothetical protein